MRMEERVTRHQLLMQQARLMADVALGESSAPEGVRSAPADERRLRGIPAIGRGVSGAIPGTQPERRIR